MSKATLKDVARRAGVSYQTVSKVLNGDASVTPETQARILDAVNALDYRVNISARNLRKQASHLIGYPLQKRPDDTPAPIADQFLYNVVSCAEERGYHLLTFLAGSWDDDKLSVFSDLIGRQQVDGFVLADTNHDDPRIVHLMASNVPFVSFGRANDSWEHCWVDVDGYAGMRKVVRHLIERGHRQIALVTWPEGSKAGYERERGYFAALAEAGLPVSPELVLRGDNNVSTGIAALRKVIAWPAAQQPTAFACVSDTIATGILNAAVPLGIAVGETLAVTGYDDTLMAAYLHPPLTTVRQPISTVGRVVVELLLKQIAQKPIGQKGILLEPELIIRNSSQNRVAA